MYLKAIIAYYHAVFLRPHMWTLLIWNFDLHVNVVNFHIIKIHESYTIGKAGEPCLCVCACVLVNARVQLQIYTCVFACENVLCVNARVRWI